MFTSNDDTSSIKSLRPMVNIMITKKFITFCTGPTPVVNIGWSLSYKFLRL